MSAISSRPIPTEKEQIKAVRSSMRRLIMLPFLGGIALIVLLVAIAGLLPDQRQTSLIADFFMILVLCPVVLCVFPIYLLMVIAIYGMGRLNQGITKPILRLERLTANVRGRTHNVAEQVGKASITLNARLASIDKTVFSIFDPVEPRGKPDEQSADEPPRG